MTAKKWAEKTPILETDHYALENRKAAQALCDYGAEDAEYLTQFKSGNSTWVSQGRFFVWKKSEGRFDQIC